MTNRVLPRERTGHSKHPLPATQEKTLHMDITRWSVLQSDWLYALQSKMKKLYTVSKNKTRSDCGSDHELLIAKSRFRFKSRESHQTIPFRYDLNQILYDYTVEVRNRFKGLDMIARVPEELWMKACDIVWEAVIKTIPKKKKCKKAKMAEEGLHIGEKRREAKGKGEKGRYTHLNAEFQRMVRRDKKTFLSDQSNY